MGRRLLKRGLSHHFRVLPSLRALSLDPRAAEATGRPPRPGGAGTCRSHVELSRAATSRGPQPWEDSASWRGASALPSRSPSACAAAPAPDVRHGPPANRAGSEGAWPPLWAPFPSPFLGSGVQLQDVQRAAPHGDETQAGASKGRLELRGPWHRAGVTAPRGSRASWPCSLPACSFLPLALSSLRLAPHFPLSVTSPWTPASRWS
nr:uncharacterized protein LOC131753254 [Kogia breviceps]